MPDEAFAWSTRIKAVEREYIVARFAVDRLGQQAQDNPEILPGDIRRRDIRILVDRLEGTYLLRVFAEFEQALRHYLRAFGIRVPRNVEQLIDKVRHKVRMDDDDAVKVHAVRLYRNMLIHDESQPTDPVSMREATRAKEGPTQEQVESKEFLDALREATGIWFGGGRQWRFVDAYEGTRAHALMHDVLKRGGVIAGSSAGATIQGDYLCRGGVFDNFDMMYEGYERGLGFLKGVGIDQHFAERKRFADMTAFVKTHPQMLGIGIDETTAIIVKGSVADVVGAGKVHFYDARRKVAEGQPDHESLGAGEKYELKERKRLP